MVFRLNCAAQPLEILLSLAVRLAACTVVLRLLEAFARISINQHVRVAEKESLTNRFFGLRGSSAFSSFQGQEFYAAVNTVRLLKRAKMTFPRSSCLGTRVEFR